MTEPGAGDRGAWGGRLARRWSRWRSESVTRRIAAAAFLVTVGTLAVKIVSAAKELIVARQFGRSADVDAYFIAMLLPNFALNVIGGSFSMALVPGYVRARSEGEAQAQRLLRGMLYWSTLVLVGAVLLLWGVGWLALPFLGHLPPGAPLGIHGRMYFILVPLVLLAGLRLQLSAVLNAHEQFTVVAALPALTPLAVMAFTLVGASTLGVSAVAIGTTVGAATELGAAAWLMRRAGLPLLPRKSPFDSSVVTIFRQWAARAAGTLLTGAMLIVDQSMAARLGAGSVAALGYGIKVPALAQGLGAGLATAALPYLSKLVADRDTEGLVRSLRAVTLRVLGLGIPAAVALAVFSRPIVQLLFQRGAFTANDTEVVASVQALYLLQVPFYILSLVLQRVVASLQGNRVLVTGAGIYLACDIVFNLVLMRILGTAGIALSTTLVTIASVLFLAYSIRGLIREQA